MKCPKCNEEIADNSKFCVKCGFNIEESKKEEKEKKKAQQKEKFLKIKLRISLILFLILIIAIIILIGLNFFGKKSHKSDIEYDVVNEIENKVEEIEPVYGGVSLELELTEENKMLDNDNDRLTNEEEVKYGTSMTNSDTDGDGLNDYDEINRYKSDPTKYSTSDDGISDYIKVERELKINRKYTEREVKVEDVKYNYNITLKPADLNSEYYGGLMEFERDQNINSTLAVFNMLNFEGAVEYQTGDSNSILLLREGKKYTEFKNYKNENGKLIIEITKEDNYKDFVITTKENYENYKNS